MRLRPGRVVEFLDDLNFSGGGRLVFLGKFAAVVLVGGLVLGGGDGGASGRSVAKSVEQRALFALVGEMAVGRLGVGAVDGRAIDLSW